MAIDRFVKKGGLSIPVVRFTFLIHITIHLLCQAVQFMLLEEIIMLRLLFSTVTSKVPPHLTTANGALWRGSTIIPCDISSLHSSTLIRKVTSLRVENHNLITPKSRYSTRHLVATLVRKVTNFPFPHIPPK